MGQAGRCGEHAVEAQIGKLGVADVVRGRDAGRRSARAFLCEPDELPKIATRHVARDRDVDAETGIRLAADDSEMRRGTACIGGEELRLDAEHGGGDLRHREIVAAGGREERRAARGLLKRLERRKGGLLADDQRIDADIDGAEPCRLVEIVRQLLAHDLRRDGAGQVDDAHGVAVGRRAIHGGDAVHAARARDVAHDHADVLRQMVLHRLGHGAGIEVEAAARSVGHDQIDVLIGILRAGGWRQRDDGQRGRGANARDHSGRHDSLPAILPRSPRGCGCAVILKRNRYQFEYVVAIDQIDALEHDLVAVVLLPQAVLHPPGKQALIAHAVIGHNHV